MKGILGGRNHTDRSVEAGSLQRMRGESEGSLVEGRMGLEGEGLGVWRGKGARGTGHVQIPGLLLVQLHFLCAAVDAIEGHKNVGVGATAHHVPCPHCHFIEYLSQEGCKSWALASTTTPGDLLYFTLTAASSTALKRSLPLTNHECLESKSQAMSLSLSPDVPSSGLERSSVSEREHVWSRNVTNHPSIN